MVKNSLILIGKRSFISSNIYNLLKKNNKIKKEIWKNNLNLYEFKILRSERKLKIKNKRQIIIVGDSNL